MRHLLPLVLLLAATAPPVFAQPATGTCAPATAQAFLEANQVRARLFNNGGLFWKGDPHVYEVPRGGGVHSIFAASLWLGGQVGAQTRVAATTYGPYEFWPGPLDDTGAAPQNCAPYDRLYRITRLMIANYESSGVAANDLRDWPTGLGAPTEKPDGNGGMERVDVSGLTHSERIARVIDLAAGERPVLSGDEMVWWIMNDAGNTHGNSGMPPLGVEVHGTAFAFVSPGPLGSTTFYRYRIQNKSGAAIEKFYAGFYADVDLGTFDDDYVGADTTLDMGFAYNAKNVDGQYGVPPALGITYLQGASVAGTQNDTVWVDGTPRPGRKGLGMTTFISYTGGADIEGDPSTGQDFYFNLQGLWKNGKPITEGGTGYNPVNPNAKVVGYIWPGDPVTEAFWSEVNVDGSGRDNPLGDRRFVLSSGPVTLGPGEVQEIVFAIVWARGADRFDSITKLRQAVREIRTAGQNIEPPPLPPITQAPAALTPLPDATLPRQTIRLTWTIPANSFAEEVRIANNEAFTENVQFFAGSGASARDGERAVDIDTLAAGTYYWQVRGTAGAEIGPWSEVQSFTVENVTLTPVEPGFANLLAVQNADGPISPPEYAAFAFNSSGFPHPTTADRPDGTRQQSAAAGLGTSQGWGFFTFGNRSTYAEFVSRATRDGANFAEIGFHDYEMRFVGESLAWGRFGGPVSVTVPFELWDIGTTPDDASDDVRLIPIICESPCGAGGVDGVFDIGSDSPLDAGGNDPYTDAIYWYRPTDTSPGQAGYLAYEADHKSISPTRAPVGAEIFARTVLMGWNVGTAPGPFAQALPEGGTVFRIITSKLDNVDAPLIAGPVDGTTLGPDSRIYWSQPDGTGAEVQIARDAAFADIVATVVAQEQGSLSVRNLPTATYSGTYYWRVRALSPAAFSPWSSARAFVLNETVVASEADKALPSVLAIESLWPSPVQDRATLRFGVPASGAVRVTLYDVLGREVQRVLVGEVAAGWHEVAVETSSLASGLYVVRVVAGGRTVTRPFIVAR